MRRAAHSAVRANTLRPMQMMWGSRRSAWLAPSSDHEADLDERDAKRLRSAARRPGPAPALQAPLDQLKIAVVKQSVRSVLRALIE